MKSIVDLEIAAPLSTVAALFSDPRNNAKWMDDIERVEPISGLLGQVGSRYRLVPKRPGLLFVATVLSRDLPRELSLKLDAAAVSVMIHAKLTALAENRTRLISDEEFRFHGIFGRVTAWLASNAVRKAHRHHIEAFKRFAEGAR